MKLFANLKKQNKILLCAALVLVLFWGYYNIFYVAQLKGVRTLKKDIINLEAIVKTMKDAGVTTVDSSTDKFRLRLKEKEFSSLRDRLNQVEGRFLEKSALSSCLSELTSLCNQCKIEVAFFAPHQGKKADSETFYQSLPLELSIRTTWHDLVSFLEELQRLPAMAILKDIELRVDKERPPFISGKLILELWLKD